MFASWHTPGSTEKCINRFLKTAIISNNSAIKSPLATSIQQNQTLLAFSSTDCPQVLTSSLKAPYSGKIFKFEQNVFHFYCWHEKLISAMWRQRLVFHYESHLGEIFSDDGDDWGAEQTKCVTKHSVLSPFFCQQICLMSFILSSHGAVNVINTEWKLCLQLFFELE